MYLNHPLVPGFPLTLRYGEERDREFLANVFTEVWAGIPEPDRIAILNRGYGKVTVDIVGSESSQKPAKEAGDIRVSRTKIDFYPKNVVAHIVARELAHKVDDFAHSRPAARVHEPRVESKKRVLAILQRWGYPARATAEFTPADDERIRANSRE